MKSKSILITVLALAATAVLSACSKTPEVSADAPETVRGLAVITAQSATVPDLLQAVGTVQAARSSQLSSQVMGTITEVRVHEGDRVKTGEVLVLIDDAQAKASLDSAHAAKAAAQQEVLAADTELGLADSTLKRYQSLYDKKSVSPQEFDEVKTRDQAATARRDLARAGLAQAKAAVAQARTALEYTRVRAPFDGVIVDRKLDPGAMASPGLAILTVEDVTRYRLEASVNENDLRFVHPGQRTPVSIDALGNGDLQGRVSEIVPAADVSSRTFVVKVELPVNKELRSGLFGHAQFSRGQKSALLVPQTAVVERGQLHGTYVLDPNGIANLRYVTLGRASGNEVEILAGIQAGESVVAQPGEVELSGKRIEGRP